MMTAIEGIRYNKRVYNIETSSGANVGSSESQRIRRQIKIKQTQGYPTTSFRFQACIVVRKKSTTENVLGQRNFAADIRSPSDIYPFANILRILLPRRVGISLWDLAVFCVTKSPGLSLDAGRLSTSTATFLPSSCNANGCGENEPSLFVLLSGASNCPSSDMIECR